MPVPHAPPLPEAAQITHRDGRLARAVEDERQVGKAAGESHGLVDPGAADQHVVCQSAFARRPQPPGHGRAVAKPLVGLALDEMSQGTSYGPP